VEARFSADRARSLRTVAMRAVFTIYLLLIAFGLVTCIVIGLAHY
jgi:hypothetical protein